MKKIQYLVTALALVFIINGCSSDFKDINDDPNRISVISPGTLLNPIIYGIASHNATRSASVTFNLMQVSLPFPSVSGGLHRYDVSPSLGNSSWNTYYKYLANISEMRIAAQKAGDANYEAISLTLNALVYSNLTDLFGPVPMTEAVRAEDGILYPKYDTQEFIYETILSDLEKANAMYDARAMIYSEDILFRNDVSKWRKFTNSLHMRLLLRISNRAESNAFSMLKTMIEDPLKYPVFTTTAESAILQVTGATPNVSPWGRPQDFSTGAKVASFFLDNLNNFNDPRRNIIATVAKDLQNKSIGYVGIPSGYEGADSQFKYNASGLMQAQVVNPMQIFLLTYAEVEFIKAEMGQRGYIADPAVHYKNGITAAMEQLKATIPANYFDNPIVQYSGTLQQIMLQKYYALYFTDYQQWFEYRRTGFPVLPTTSAMGNKGVMPSRFTFPTDQELYNVENYNKAVKMIGEDTINTKVWWDN